MDSLRHSLMEHRVTMPAENVVLHKLEEVNKSVKVEPFSPFQYVSA